MCDSSSYRICYEMRLCSEAEAQEVVVSAWLEEERRSTGRELAGGDKRGDGPKRMKRRLRTNSNCGTGRFTL